MAYDRQLGYIILANGTYDYQFYLNKSWVNVYENGSKTDLDSIGCSGWVGKNSAAGSFVNYNYDCGYGWQVGYIPLYDAKLIEDRRPTTTTTTVPPTTITTTTPLKTTTGTTTTYTTTPQTIPNTTTNTTTTPLWTT
ncbi:MAG: hypothetical protein IKL32_05710, partial [Alphaproteobacteria bacterium]|nr:hypothetical protein [Alphaproteobacteria bacterium]